MEQAIAERIKKLLALGESSNLNEAENAITAAFNLAEKYSISIAEMEEETWEIEEEIEKEVAPFIEGGRIREWKKHLVHMLLKERGCASYNSRSGRSHYATSGIYAFGRPSDLEAARFMIAYALAELGRIGTHATKGMGKNYANSWYMGAVYGIEDKLREGKKETREQSGATTTALAKVDSRYDEAREKMYGSMRLKSAPVRRVSLNHNAFVHGRAVGRTINLGTNRALKS